MERSLASETPPHAYIFAGPAGVGKATLARWLAQALNCEPTAAGPDITPCSECKPCTRITGGIHADVQTISFDTADDGRVLTEISVDRVREVERAVALAPYEGRTRVVIIDPAEAMSDAAQNAFLKTLEEPPPHAVFVLITTDEEGLLPTVRSRCRRVEFRLLPSSEVEAALTAAGVEPEQAALLARFSGGRIGWALDATNDPALLERRSQALEQARAIPDMPVHERMKLSEKLSEQFKQQRAPVFALLDEWLGWWRDVLLLQASAEAGVVNADQMAELRETADRHSREAVMRFVQALLAAREHLHANVQSRIALDLVLLEAPPVAADARP
jgi:DNA polymerase-3 subunit delta'